MSHSIKQLADYTGVFELVGVKCRLYIAWKIVTVYYDIFGVWNIIIEIPIPPNFKVNIRQSNNKPASFCWSKRQRVNLSIPVRPKPVTLSFYSV